jgi:putative mRNA 3-end processing factor
MARPRRPPARAFVHRGGVRISGTHITCDAAGSASDLVFISHAQAVGQPGRRRFPVRRAGRQELLATEGTLVLLGRAGERLRRHALPAPFRRPFVLGDLRLELVPSGHLPGAASLLCDLDDRRVLYLGSLRQGTPALGAEALVARRADAICVDGTFGHPRFVFPPAAEALAAAVRFVRDALGAGRTPVLLAPPYGAAMDVAAALAAEGIALRGHRAVVAASGAFRAAGVNTPLIGRFEGKVGPEEALLWPPEGRDAPMLGVLAQPSFAFVSGFSVDPELRARMRADAAIPLSNQSGYPDLVAQIEATGAREVAVSGGFCEDLAEDLRRRGHEAYALGPPRQMELFRG